MVLELADHLGEVLQSRIDSRILDEVLTLGVEFPRKLIAITKIIEAV